MEINVNKSKEKESFNWSTIFIVSLTSIVAGIYRDGFASLFPFLQRDFDLTRAQLGLHTTLFYFTSALIAIYTGRLVDLKGSKWGLIYGSAFMGTFFILHSIAPNFIIILLMAAFTGLSVSINFPAASKCIIERFPKKQRGTALGMQSIAFPLGGMLGAVILPYLASMLGWRKIILFPGILALSCAFFISRFYHDKRKTKDHLKKEGANNISFWKNFHQLIKNRDLIKISIFGFFLGVISGVTTAHFTIFLFLDYGLTETIAGLGFAVFQCGSMLGRPAWGLICDRILESDKRKTFLYMGFLFTSTAMIFGLFLRNLEPPISILFSLSFLAGFSGNGWPGLFAASISETVKEENVGIAIGLASLFMRSGIMLAPPILGYIADQGGSYNFSWLILGLIMFLASVGQYISNKKYKEKNKKSFGQNS